MRQVPRRGTVLLAALAIAIIAIACLPPPPSGPLKLSPASLDYGSHPLADLLGANMPIINVTVTNSGSQTVHLASEHSSNGIFSLPVNTCSTNSLAPGASCLIEVQYCPNAPGTSTSTLTVNGTIGTTPVSASASITGTAT